MFWCPGAQNIGLSNHELKAVLKCTVLLQGSPVPYGQTNGQTDGRTSWQ